MIKKIAIIGLSLLSAACFSGDMENAKPQALPYETRHPIQVVASQQNMEVSLQQESPYITPATEAKIKSFVYGYQDKGNNNIVISIPETGMKATAARIATKKITDILTESDVPPEKVTIKTYQPSSIESGNIRLSFEKNIAKAPDCRNKWSENTSDAYRNTSWKGLGCATRRNLAAMIVRPQDLEEMRPMGTTIAERRVNGLDKFVIGQTTGSARDASETASASK